MNDAMWMLYRDPAETPAEDDDVDLIYPAYIPGGDASVNFLDRAVARVGNWTRSLLGAVSNRIQLLVVSNYGEQAVMGYSNSANKRNPKTGDMDTVGGEFIGELRPAFDASGRRIYGVCGYGTYAEIRVGSDGDPGANEFSAQNTSGKPAGVPGPFNLFPGGEVAHVFATYKTTSGTVWPYATGPISAFDAYIASRNEQTGKTAPANRGRVVMHDAIAAIDGHRVVDHFAAGQELIWERTDGATLRLTGDGEQLLIEASGKKFRVALQPIS